MADVPTWMLGNYKHIFDPSGHRIKASCIAFRDDTDWANSPFAEVLKDLNHYLCHVSLIPADAVLI